MMVTAKKKNKKICIFAHKAAADLLQTLDAHGEKPCCGEDASAVSALKGRCARSVSAVFLLLMQKTCLVGAKEKKKNRIYAE